MASSVEGPEATTKVSRLRRAGEGLPPRVTVKAVDEVINTIRTEIAGGMLERGERLPNERDLAREFAVSQPTVREALRVLEATGFVRTEHGRGTFVAGGVQQFIARSLETLLELESVGIVQVQEVRTALAQYSIHQAAERATAEDLADIEARHLAIVELSSDDDTTLIAEAIIAFHISVSKAAHNPLLLALESFLIQLIVDFMVKAVEAGYTENWLNTVRMRIPQREAVLNALKSRDAAECVAVTMSYLNSQHQAFLDNKRINTLRLANPGALKLVSTVAATP